jgi:hypothetical protein
VGESPHLLQNGEISEYPVGESAHLLQNREIFDIRIRYFISECNLPNGAAKAQKSKYPKISSRISASPSMHAARPTSICFQLPAPLTGVTTGYHPTWEAVSLFSRFSRPV